MALWNLPPSEAIYGASDNILWYKPMDDDGDALSADPTGTIKIYAPGTLDRTDMTSGVKISTGMTWDATNERLTYTLDASTVADWPIGNDYVWIVSWTDTTVKSSGLMYFDIDYDKWRPNLGVAELRSLSPFLADFDPDYDLIKSARRAAMEDLRRKVYYLHSNLSYATPTRIRTIADQGKVSLALQHLTLQIAYSGAVSSSDGDDYPSAQAAYHDEQFGIVWNDLESMIQFDPDMDGKDNDPNEAAGAIRLMV